MLKKTILGGMLSHCAAGGGFAILATVLVLSGCGQKGPLFLPPPPPKATPHPAAAQPAATPAAGDKTKTPAGDTATR